MMSKSYLSQFVVAHKPALVDVSIYTIDVAFSRILPHGNVSAINEYGLSLGILGNHNLIVVKHSSRQNVVVEVGTCINQGLLLVLLFYQMQKLGK